MRIGEMMKSWIMSGLILAMFGCFLGCGPTRPDPRDNPDFDEEAWSDPNIAVKRMGEGPKVGQ
jgi:hypothetical protein